MTETATLARRAVTLEERPIKIDTTPGPSGGGSIGDGRTVLVRLVKYGVDAQVTDDGGRSYYTERFAPGSVRAEIGALVYREIPRAADPHFDKPILVGKIVGFRSFADGAYAEVRVSGSTAGTDLLADIDEGIMRHVSMEFDAPTLPKPGTRANGPVVHTDAVVHGLLFTNQPQSPGADVLGRRADTQGAPMSETPVAGPFKGTIEGNIDGNIITPDPVAQVDMAGAPADAGANAGGRAAPTQVPRLSPSLAPAGATRAAPLSSYESFGEFAYHAARGAVDREERARTYRALNQARHRGTRALDQTVAADVGGLLPPVWIRDILDLVVAYTPTINAFSQRPLPDSGLTVNRPVIAVRPTVAVQAAEGAAISSTKPEIDPATWTVGVYGGGHEMSITVMQRSDPSYIDASMRMYAVQMALALEVAVAAQVVADANNVNAVIDLAEAADTDLQPAFTAACLPFLTNLGRLPTFALLSTKLWARMANAVGSDDRPMFPTVSPFNPQGTLSLTDPTGQIRDLPFKVAPALDPTGLVSTAIVGVPEAFETLIGSMQTLQADVPETLVHQMAVYEFATFGTVDAAGLVQIVPVP